MARTYKGEHGVIYDDSMLLGWVWADNHPLSPPPPQHADQCPTEDCMGGAYCEECCTCNAAATQSLT